MQRKKEKSEKKEILKGVNDGRKELRKKEKKYLREKDESRKERIGWRNGIKKNDES